MADDRTEKTDPALVAAEPTADAAKSGTTDVPQFLEKIGDYDLIERLGEGGMGAVFKARHRELGTIHAVKLLHPKRTADRRAVERFQREMIAIGRLDHPNIVRANDAGDEKDVHYLVMEFVPGIDLATLTKSFFPGDATQAEQTVLASSPEADTGTETPLADTAPAGGAAAEQLRIADACEMVRQAAVALDYVHRQGRVHRDVKPSNLMLAADGTVKLLDLGLARLGDLHAEEEFNVVADQETIDDDLPASLTRTNQVMGTLEYMAPEQGTDARNVDARADIYSLGCTLYKLLAGRAPFGDPKFSTSTRQIFAHANEPVPPIADFRPEVPDKLAAILNRMLAKDPGERYATAGDVATAMVDFAARADLKKLARIVVPQTGTETDSPFARSVAGEMPLPPVVIAPSPPKTSLNLFLALSVAAGIVVLMCAGIAGIIALMMGIEGPRFGPAQSVATAPTGPTAPAAKNIDAAVDVSEEAASKPQSQVTLPPLPAPAGDAIDLFAMIDLERDSPVGQWERDSEGVISVIGTAAYLQFPYIPPPEYRIEATVEKLDGNDGPNFGVVVDGRQLRLAIDNWPHLGYLSGPHAVNGRALNLNRQLAHQGMVLPRQKPVKIACTVRHVGANTSLRVDVDGAEVFQWQGETSRLGLEPWFRTPNPTLFLMCWSTKLKFTELTVQPLGEEGRLLEFADPANEPDLAAAQRVLWKGGLIELLNGDRAAQPANLMDFANLVEQASGATGDDSPQAGDGLWSVTAIDASNNKWFRSADLHFFRNLRELRRLRFDGITVTPADIAAMNDLPKLAELSLSGGEISQASVAELGRFPKLRQLDLSTAVCDQSGAKTLAELPELTTVDLSCVPLADDELQQVATSGTIAELCLDHTAVTNAGLAPLRDMPALRDLSMMGTRIDDNAVEELSQFTRLSRLSLLGTDLTAEGAAQIRNGLPQVAVATNYDSTIDLMPLLSLKSRTVRGRWTETDEGVRCGDHLPAFAPIPLTPPEEYDIEMLAERISGIDGVALLLRGGGRQFLVEFDHGPASGPYTLIDMIDGKRFESNESSKKQKTFEIGVPVRVGVQVRRDRIRVLRDDEVVIDWSAGYERLGMVAAWQQQDSRIIGIGAYRGEVEFKRLTLKPLSGPVQIVVSRPAAKNSEQNLAAWALQHGGRVVVTFDGITEQELSSVDELPDRPLWIRELRGVDGTEVPEAIVSRLADAEQLRTLDLSNTQFDDRHLLNIHRANSLRELWLAGTPVSDTSVIELAKLRGLERLDLSGTQITDAALDHVSGMSNLVELRLHDTAVSDAGLEKLSAFDRLQKLGLNGTRVTDAGLPSLSDLTGLYEIRLGRTQVTGTGFAALSRCPFRFIQLGSSAVTTAGLTEIVHFKSLVHLDIAGAKIADDDLRLLQGMNRLAFLHLGFTQVRGPGLVHLQTLPNLRRLLLGDTKIENQAIGHLAGCARLEFVSLAGTAVDDEGIAQLADIATLVEVQLAETKTTEAGLRALLEKRPELQIRVGEDLITKEP